MTKLLNNCWTIFKKILYSITKACFALFHKDLSDEAWASFLQFVKFGIIGVSNTVVAYLIYVVCLLLFHKLGIFLRWDYIIANTTSFVLSVLWSFYWNNKYVFSLEDKNWKKLFGALIKMYLSYAFTGFILSNILSYVWIDVLHISKFIAPLINSAIGVPINFVLNKFWAFREKK